MLLTLAGVQYTTIWPYRVERAWVSQTDSEHGRWGGQVLSLPQSSAPQKATLITLVAVGCLSDWQLRTRTRKTLCLFHLSTFGVKLPKCKSYDPSHLAKTIVKSKWRRRKQEKRRRKRRYQDVNGSLSHEHVCIYWPWLWPDCFVKGFKVNKSVIRYFKSSRMFLLHDEELWAVRQTIRTQHSHTLLNPNQDYMDVLEWRLKRALSLSISVI